jgi:hypothetical protein
MENNRQTVASSIGIDEALTASSARLVLLDAGCCPSLQNLRGCWL